MNYRARYYHPALGRFISADTIVPSPGDPQALNRYAYVQNNPLKYTDPTGHALWAGGEGDFGETPPPPPSPAQWAAEYLSQSATWYDARQILAEAGVEYDVPALLNALKLPVVSDGLHAVTRPGAGTVWYGLRPGSWSLKDPEVLWRTTPSVVPGWGDVIGGCVVVGQDAYKYTLGEKRGSSFQDFYNETVVDLVGYGISNVAGEVGGLATAGFLQLLNPEIPGVPLAAGYFGGNFAVSTGVSYWWETRKKPEAITWLEQNQAAAYDHSAVNPLLVEASEILGPYSP